MPIQKTIPRKPRERNSAVIYTTIGESSLGLVLVAQSGSGVCAVLLGDNARTLQREMHERFPDATLINGNANHAALAAKVIRFIESPTCDLTIPLDLRGTSFQRTVWDALREIPIGSTVSYTDIANHIGRPQSVRAVATACAANPLAVVIPCHRVLRRDGALSGYRWGVERKRALLKKESEHTA